MPASYSDNNQPNPASMSSTPGSPTLTANTSGIPAQSGLPVVLPGSSNTDPAPAGAISSASNAISSAQNGLSSGGSGSNSAATEADYLSRASALGNNVNKIALVGRTGAGARNLTGSIGTGSSAGVAGLGNTMSSVIFEATPELSESGSTVLIDIGDIRAAASVVIYMGSPSRSFGLTARFVSRTPAEAATNIGYINILKAWRMPTIKLNESFGAEPETLRLYAYGKVLKGIPCMIQSLNIEYPSEVDYIQYTNKTGSGWVPIVQNVSIQLKEVRSIDDLATFSYTDFKAGNLDQW